MEIFRGAKAYVDPTGLEGFPAMSLYALSEGCPVVAPRAGAVPELLSDGKNALLFQPGDPASLAQALVKLASVRGLSLHLISAGVATAHGQTWDATASAACDALEGLAP
jgi:glycosyltransferase involved in cell wall biosynthesis